jgi:hypothetical protein
MSALSPPIVTVEMVAYLFVVIIHVIIAVVIHIIYMRLEYLLDCRAQCDLLAMLLEDEHRHLACQA